MDDLHRAMAERIRTLAAERGIVLTHLPDRCGVGAGHFWRVMGGTASPTVAWLERVAETLEVSVSELVAPPTPPKT